MIYSKVPDDSEFLKHLKSTQDLELYDLEFYKLTVDTQEGQALVLLTANDKMVGIELNGIEGTMFTFAASGCLDNSHLRTIYQMYLDTMQMVQFKLIQAVIESKKGDMLYARMHWKDHKGRTIYKVCSAGDGLVLANMTEAPIKITKIALEQMDDYSNFENEYGQEDEE